MIAVVVGCVKSSQRTIGEVIPRAVRTDSFNRVGNAPRG